MKGKSNDLNHDLTFSAHTINCVCYSISSTFLVYITLPRRQNGKLMALAWHCNALVSKLNSDILETREPNSGFKINMWSVNDGATWNSLCWVSRWCPVSFRQKDQISSKPCPSLVCTVNTTDLGLFLKTKENLSYRYLTVSWVLHHWRTTRCIK